MSRVPFKFVSKDEVLDQFDAFSPVVNRVSIEYKSEHGLNGFSDIDIACAKAAIQALQMFADDINEPINFRIVAAEISGCFGSGPTRVSNLDPR